MEDEFTAEQLAAAAKVANRLNPQSCVGCKYLYSEGQGYSNYTWMSNSVSCALDKNPHLIDGPEEPSDWQREPRDNWPMTNASRCDLYSLGEFIGLDVDGEDNAADYSTDQEQIDAINKHCGRPRR